MENETTKAIEEIVKKELDRRMPEKPRLFSYAYIKSHFMEFVTVLVSLFAIVISYYSYRISYESANPKAYYDIDFDIFINENLTSFGRLIEQYMNDRTYKDIAFNLHLKVKNKKPSITPRLDVISGDFQIHVWQLERKTKGKYAFKHISTIKEFLPAIPITFVGSNKHLERPIIKDLLVGHIEYDITKEKSWLNFGRFDTKDIFDLMDELGDLTLSTRYVGSYPEDWEPSKEKYFDPFNKYSRWNRIFPKKVQDVPIEKMAFVKFVGHFEIEDHLDNKREVPLVLVYEAWLGNPDHKSKFDRAEQLYKLGNFNKASEILNTLIENNPYYEEAYHLLGLSMAKQEKIDSAMDFFQKAAELRYSESNYHIAKYHVDNGDYLKSTPFVAAYVLDKWKPRTELNDTMIMKYISDLLIPVTNSVNEDKWGADDKHNLAIGYYVCGISFKRDNKLEKAKSYLTEAIILSPSFLSAYHELAKIHYEQKEYEDAAKMYRKNIQLSEDDAEHKIVGSWSSTEVTYYLYYLGMSYLKLNNYQESIETFRKLINRNPEHYSGFLGYTGLSSVYIDLGDNDTTIEYLERSLKIARNDKHDTEKIKKIENKINDLKK